MNRKHFLLLAGSVLVAVLFIGGLLLLDGRQEEAITPSGQMTMYASTADSERSPGVLYPRAIQLAYSGRDNGKMYATFEHYMPETPSFPIYESADNGATWSLVSEVTDQVNGWGMRYQPILFELPEPVGAMPAGTVLCAGLSFPDDESECRIELYQSADRCRTWTYVGTIAVGGRLSIDGSADPIWEPFFLVKDGRLICYYSDSRDYTVHSQKLVHQTSADGLNWSDVVDDVSLDPVTERPGMSIVTRIGSGDYLLMYEIVRPGSNHIFYKISGDPESWNPSEEGTQLVATDGTIPNGTPYVVWMDDGSQNGVLVASGWNRQSLFINRQSGDPDSWETIDCPVGAAYSRSLCPLGDGESLFIIGAGTTTGRYNNVSYAVMSLAQTGMRP